MPESAAAPIQPFKARLLIASPTGPVELDAASASLPLPQGPEGDAPLLTYGPYLDSLERFLFHDECRTLRKAVCLLRGAPITSEHLRTVDIISEKHGALYNVARVHVVLSEGECTLALCSATTDPQKGVMAREAQALREVRTVLKEDLLPRVLLEGEALYADKEGDSKTLSVLVTGWFDNFHEFHATRTEPDAPLATVVWEGERGRTLLEDASAAQIYREAARLLTLCYDAESARQVYPWHHAAGDFIVRREGGAIEVRLITVRDYVRLMPEEVDESNALLALIHFFLNLSVRMRLDRLDGTGDLVWMERPCLGACVAGFLDACSQRHLSSGTFPDAKEMVDVLRSFDEAEWLELLQVVVPDGLIESDEAAFLAPRLDEHARELSQVLLTPLS